MPALRTLSHQGAGVNDLGSRPRLQRFADEFFQSKMKIRRRLRRPLWERVSNPHSTTAIVSVALSARRGQSVTVGMGYTAVSDKDRRPDCQKMKRPHVSPSSMGSNGPTWGATDLVCARRRKAGAWCHSSKPPKPACADQIGIRSRDTFRRFRNRD